MSTPHDTPPSPFELLQQSSLKHGGQEIRALTAALDDRIQALESWLEELPGRVDTWVSIQDPEDPDNYYFQLRLMRPGWKLNCRYVRRQENAPTPDWKWVKLSTVDAKIATIVAVPHLLAAMLEAQSNLRMRLQEANVKADLLAQVIGLSTKKGA